MPTNKFQVGQTVFVDPSVSQNIPGGAYIVTRKLPERDGEFQYRVKSVNEPHERAVREKSVEKNIVMRDGGGCRLRLNHALCNTSDAEKPRKSDHLWQKRRFVPQITPSTVERE